MGTTDVVFTVLAFNAPLSVVVGFVPVIIGFGNQLGAPVTFLASGALMMLFAVGFTAMSRHLPNPGAFYAYVTAGLGREVGLGGAFLAIYSYIFILIGGYVFGGLALNGLVHGVLGGPDIPWWTWVLVLQAIAGMLGYFKIDLSAKVLTTLMCGELIIVAVWEAVVLFKGGPHGHSLTPFTPHAIMSGSVGLAVLFGIACFSGFEATAIFREEVRQPHKTIPRATYIAIAAMAGMYALAAYVLITAYGGDAVVNPAATDPTGSVTASFQTYVGHVAVDAVTVLLCTSIFAANLATHNVTARYLYSLSVDEVLTPRLSAVHHRHGSPHRASLSTSIVSVTFLIGLALAHLSAATLYATLIGIGGYALIMMLLLTSIAVVPYFLRHRPAGVALDRWKMVIAPSLAVAGLAVSLYLATTNVTALTGQSATVSYTVLALSYVVFVVGIVTAVILRRRRPQAYARIGRQEL
jgi:amino acid transporter